MSEQAAPVVTPNYAKAFREYCANERCRLYEFKQESFGPHGKVVTETLYVAATTDRIADEAIKRHILGDNSVRRLDRKEAYEKLAETASQLIDEQDDAGDVPKVPNADAAGQDG